MDAKTLICKHFYFPKNFTMAIMTLIFISYMQGCGPKPDINKINAQLEVKLAENEPADGLVSITLEEASGKTLYVHDKSFISTVDIAGVYESKDQFDRPAITVVLTKEGRERMLSMTSTNIGKHVVIFVNGETVSAPIINKPISKEFVIVGSIDKIDRLFQTLTQQ